MPEKMKINVAKITEVKPVGSGDRCCIDLLGEFKVGEGMLVGMIGNGLFLVHSETIKNPFTNTRPFRVNAGPVSAYTLVPGKKKEYRTKYLRELKRGDEVVVIDYKGNMRVIKVGRNKIENRPFLLVEAQVEGKSNLFPKAYSENGGFHTFIQHAETIMLVGKKGKPIRADILKKGDEVLVWLENPERVGRHFGTAVRETIIEQ